MFRTFVVTLLISSIFAQSFLPIQENTKTQDFITGFLMGSGIIVRIPNAFPCAVQAEAAPIKFQEAIADIKNGGLENIVEGIQILTQELEQITNSCGPVAVQLAQTFADIKNIVTDAGFTKLAQQRLYENAERVGRDIAEAFLSNKQGDALMEGLRVGDIVSVVLWG